MPDALVRPNSIRHAFRFAQSLWLVSSALYLLIYLYVADIASDHTHGYALAAGILLPAILVPPYIWRSNFATRREAIIRSAALGIAITGLLLTYHQLGTRFHQFAFDFGHTRLQVEYISVVLLLSCIAAGIGLGQLRWIFLKTANSHASPPIPPAAWRRFVDSAILWIASVMLVGTVVGIFAGWHFSSIYAYLGIVTVVPGSILIAPLPLLVPADPSRTLGRRIWKYWQKCFWVVGALFAILFLIGMAFAKSPLIAVYFVMYAVYFVPATALLCLPWSIFTALAQHPPPAPITEAVPVSNDPSASLFFPSILSIAAISVAVQPLILLPALWATSPAPLGLAGIGCVDASYTNPSQYWFSQSYKGVYSTSSNAERMVYRLATNHHVCGVIDLHKTPSLEDPKQKTTGYANAARAWLWLIDPDDWNGPRTKEILLELKLLLGKDFSSYSELQDWWNQSNRHLVWDDSNNFLAVHEPTIEEMAHRTYTFTWSSPVEEISLHSNDLDSPATDKLDPQQGHPLKWNDREDRLRGLKLAAKAKIATLSGERDRNARLYLQSLTGRNFDTQAEWQNFFAGNPPAPWNMSREAAQGWIGLIHLYGYTAPYHSRYVKALSEATGLNYSEPEDYIPWLRDPSNSRQEEWLKGRDMIYDLTGFNPLATQNSSMDYLKFITDQSFTEPEAWVHWWQANHSILTLSKDGHKLTGGR